MSPQNALLHLFPMQSTCDDEGSCIWGPVSCPGDDTQNATTMFYEAVDTAKSFCSGTTPTVTAEDMLISEESRHQIGVDEGPSFSAMRWIVHNLHIPKSVKSIQSPDRSIRRDTI